MKSAAKNGSCTGRPMKGYVFVDPEAYESETDLRHWLELALAFNPKAKASKKRYPTKTQ